MTIFVSLCVVVFATLVTTRLPAIARRFGFSVSRFSYIDAQFKYQILLLGVASLVLGIAYILNGENFVAFFGLGNMSAPAGSVSWLGIGPGESWKSLGVGATIAITLATLAFMALGVWKAKANPAVAFRFLPWILLFSLTNSFAEEAIFRLGLAVSLYGTVGVGTLLILSAVLFGIPHFRGAPGGVAGVIMAGVLGWLLMKSVIETSGIGWAWAIHFVQDIVIYAGIVIMAYHNEKRGIKAA